MVGESSSQMFIISTFLSSSTSVAASSSLSGWKLKPELFFSSKMFSEATASPKCEKALLWLSPLFYSFSRAAELEFGVIWEQLLSLVESPSLPFIICMTDKVSKLDDWHLWLKAAYAGCLAGMLQWLWFFGRISWAISSSSESLSKLSCVISSLLLSWQKLNCSPSVTRRLGVVVVNCVNRFVSD